MDIIDISDLENQFFKIQNGSIQYEAELIASILVDPDILMDLTDIVPEDFFNSKYRQTYTVMLEIFQENEIKIDILSLQNRFGKNAEAIIPTLSKLLLSAFTSANFRLYADKIKEISTKRKLIGITYDIANKIIDDSVDSKEIIEYLSQADIKFDRKENDKSANIENIVDVAVDFIIVNKAKAEAGKNIGIPTLFGRLDQEIVGICPGHLWTILGYTSDGKSALLTQFVVNFMKQGAKGIMFSVEDEKRDKTLRLLSNLIDIPVKRLYKGDFLNDTIKRINYSQRIIKDWDLRIYDDIYTIEEIFLKTKTAIRDFGHLDFIAIDYVQNLRAKGTKGIYEQMNYISMGLQNLCKRLNVGIIALSQTDNETARNTNKKIIGTKGGGELAAVSDIVIVIDREVDKPDFKLILRKNRAFGGLGTIPCHFSKNWTRIEEDDVF